MSVNMRNGSVLLEFMLMVPVLLLLFGATMLWFDLSLGETRLQESNRNLAWLAGDRYDDGRISAGLVSVARESFDLRNKVEATFDGGGNDPFWSFGSGNPGRWGRTVERYEDGHEKMFVSSEWDWGAMVSGNMELRMTHLSGVYLGVVALGSVLTPDNEAKPLYQSSYVLTRSRQAATSTNGNDVVAQAFNPESFVLHRTGSPECREDVTTPNGLLPIVLDPWPRRDALLGRIVSGLGSAESLLSGLHMDN